MNKTQLTKQSLVERWHLTYDVFTKFQKMIELPDGYELHYPGDDGWRTKLHEFVEIWRRTCPFFTYKLTTEPNNGEIRLEIRGPEGTKNFIEGSHHMLTSTLNPAPSIRQALKWRFASLTSSLRVLPDFLIIGAKKCGTTSLYSYLIQHPSVISAFRKEVQFFNYGFENGINWYRRFFPNMFRKYVNTHIMGRRFVTGEATADYLFFPQACTRIAQVLPNAKLIAVLRNPVDRAYSAFQHQVRVGMEFMSFEDAIRTEREKAKTKKKTKGTYLGRGVYANYLKFWFDAFRRDQILVLATDDLENHPSETYRRMTEFLELSSHELTLYSKLNAVPYPVMAEDTRQQLSDYYQPHNQRLYELLGEDFGWG